MKPKKAKQLLFLIAFIILNASAFSQTVIYVDSSASGLNNGLTWQDAFTHLDSAFGHVVDYEDTIKVAKGTYYPSLIPENIASGDSRDVSFYMPIAAIVQGGYASGGLSYNPLLFKTILSGDIGVKGDVSDNAYHTIILSGSDIEIFGLSIEGGNANGIGSLMTSISNFPRNYGGGIICYNSYIDLHDLNVENNYGELGGAVYQDSSESYFTNIIFTGNGAIQGGAFYNDEASTTYLKNIVAYNNQANDRGGAIFNNNPEEYIITNCTFVDNHASSPIGGAIYNRINGASSKITNSIFSGNYCVKPQNVKKFGSDIADELNRSVVRNCLVQSPFTLGKNYMVSDPAFKNYANPKGNDNLWRTADDGLSITAQSQAFKTGENGMVDFDITGAPRPDFDKLDVGAYEIDPCSLLSSRTVFVDSSANGDLSGTSWANALTSLQGAINLVRLGCVDTIKIAAGTYKPTNYLQGTDDSPLLNGFVYQLPSNITIQGGYPTGGSATPDTTNRAILSTDFGRVLFAGDVSNIHLNNLIIRNGYLSGSSYDSISVYEIKYPQAVGAGMLIYNASVDIKNTNFENNYATIGGGGFTAVNSALKLKNCNFIGNSARDEGGAGFIYNAGVGSSIESSNFHSNTAQNYGGALSVRYTFTYLNISKSTFSNNSSTSDLGTDFGGGAISTNDGTSLTLQETIFDSNNSVRGGALNINGSICNISKCLFQNNVATLTGGAIDESSNNTTIYNSVFVNNLAQQTGGAIHSYSHTTIYFSTFVRNRAELSNGCLSGSYVINNSVLWNNNVAGDSLSSSADFNGGNSNAAYCASRIHRGSHSIAMADPKFKDIDNIKGPDNIFGTNDDGLNILINSPFINEGQGSYDTLLIATSITDAPRKLSIEPDMGAYEIEFCSLSAFVNKTVYVDSSASTGDGSGRDWGNAFTDLESALKAIRAGCNIDTIKVAKGTYRPSAEVENSAYNINNKVKSTFNFEDNMVLLGGYPSGGGIRDFRYNRTLLSGTLSDSLPYNNVESIVTIKNRTGVTIDGVTISGAENNNTVSGALFANNSQLIIANSIVEKNTNGGVYFTNCSGKFINCVVDSNENYVYGGVYCSNSPIEYINCIFSNNNSFDGAGAAVSIVSSAVPSFTNCTFYGNTGHSGGALSSQFTPVISNCLFWNNKNYIYTPIGSESEYEYVQFGGEVDSLKISHSLFQYLPQNYSGKNCIYTVNPSLADSSNVKGADNIWGTEDDGLRQTNSSYTINHGHNDSIPAYITTDITGNPRINTGIVDIGAYEFNCGYTGFTNGVVPFGSVEQANNSVTSCGIWQYRTSNSDPTNYIIEIDPNGNTNFSPLDVTIDVTNSSSHIKTNGNGDTTVLANRMISINAPGQFTINGGVKIRIFYNPIEFDTLSGMKHHWFKHIAHNKTDVLADLQYDTLKNSSEIFPDSYGMANGLHYVEFHNLKNFSTFGYLGNTHLGTLPLRFLSFDAKWKEYKKAILLEWVTTDEKNVQSFEVQRSENSYSWIVLGNVNADNSPASNHFYNWMDGQPTSGSNFYRIKQIDSDGKASYSNVKMLKANGHDPSFKITPNPVSNIAVIRLDKVVPELYYKLTNIAGNIIKSGSVKNSSSFNIPLQNQSSGVYYLTVNGETQKLILIK